MRRTIITTLLCFVISNTINAQLLVDGDGKVGIRYTGESIDSYFSVNGPGDPDMCSYILSDADSLDIGLRVTKTGNANTGHTYSKSVMGNVILKANSSKMGYGFYSHVFKESAIETNEGRSFGIYAIAGNSTPGWNYGVFGTLFGNNNGAGVFGSSVDFDNGINTEGRYAGFFHGNVKATNAMYATAFNVTSDYRLKEGIESIEPECIDNIMKLNVVRYGLKQRTVDVGDTTAIPVNYYAEDPDLLRKTHYGLIAQELQDIYPDLVYEGDDGYLSVNYIELIPILIQSIQSLKNEVDQLKGNKKNSKRASESSSLQSGIESSSVSKISVSDQIITITCIIPNTIKNVHVIIYDVNGNQMYSDKIDLRGHIEYGIKDLALNDGIYVCLLVTDDDVVSRRFYYGR